MTDNSFLNTSLLFRGVSVLFLWPKTTFLFEGRSGWRRLTAPCRMSWERRKSFEIISSPASQLVGGGGVTKQAAPPCADLIVLDAWHLVYSHHGHTRPDPHTIWKRRELKMAPANHG